MELSINVLFWYFLDHWEILICCEEFLTVTMCNWIRMKKRAMKHFLICSRVIVMKNINICSSICQQILINRLFAAVSFMMIMMTMSFLLEQMSLCENENLVHLKSAYKQKTLFSPDLKLDTFLLILEILKNLRSKKSFSDLFVGLWKKSLKNIKKC